MISFNASKIDQQMGDLLSSVDGHLLLWFYN